jgi:hypothetical protein
MDENRQVIVFRSTLQYALSISVRCLERGIQACFHLKVLHYVVLVNGSREGLDCSMSKVSSSASRNMHLNRLGKLCLSY